MRSKIAVLVLILAQLGCGYSLVGTSNFLPPELDELFVPTFENKTAFADLDQRLTEAVTAEWVRRRRFKLVKTEAEAELVFKGVVSKVTVSPVTFDDSGRATEYQLILACKVQLIDRTVEEPVVLWEDPSFSRRTSYEVDVDAVSYFDRQIEAIDEVADDLARVLVSTVLEGF